MGRRRLSSPTKTGKNLDVEILHLLVDPVGLDCHVCEKVIDVGEEPEMEKFPQHLNTGGKVLTLLSGRC